MATNQKQCFERFLESYSVEEAASCAGVPLETALEWLESETEKARLELLSLKGPLQRASLLAISNLEELMLIAEEPGDKIRAADTLLRHLFSLTKLWQSTTKKNGKASGLEVDVTLWDFS